MNKDNKSIEELINDFINDEYINMLLRPTTFEIYAKGNDEIAHSSFLGTLFDAKKNGGYGDVPLKKLIKLLEEKRPGVFDSSISKSNILFENYELVNIDSQNGSRIMTEQGWKYIDLKIDFSYYLKSNDKNKLTEFSIIVENKIDSKEHDNQTTYYYEGIEKQQKSCKNIYVYLTPSKKGKEPSCKEFIWITYADLFEYVIEPLSRNNYENTYFYFNLLDYKKVLLKKTNINIEDTNKKTIKDNYNALFKQNKNLSDDDKKLLENFKETYKEIYAILKIKGQNDYYDFIDLGLTNEDRLYFSAKKRGKNDEPLSLDSEEIKKFEKKYEIYPNGSKGLILYEIDSAKQTSYESSSELVQFLYDKEGLTQSVANAKDNLCFKDKDAFYSLTQLRKKQLEENN